MRTFVASMVSMWQESLDDEKGGGWTRWFLMENIEGIKILHVDGLGGGGGGSRSPTDEVIESALRYRAQAPLIDEMMKEIGVENPNVSRMGDIFRSAKDAQSIAKDARIAKEIEKKKDE